MRHSTLTSAAPDFGVVVERDAVYACHLAVFPEIADLVKMTPERMAPARATCARATF